METKEQINQFMILMRKSETELRAICEGLQIDLTGDKESLVNRLISQEAQPQTDPLLPQAIPLRSVTDSGSINTYAIRCYKTWRKNIFLLCKAPKDFKLVDSQGKPYIQSMRYVAAASQVIDAILNYRMYDPTYTDQETLIKHLADAPQDFSAHIVQKQVGSKSFLMLHVELKRAA